MPAPFFKEGEIQLKAVASEIFLISLSLLMLAEMQVWNMVGSSRGISPAAWPVAILCGILALSVYRIIAKKAGKIEEKPALQNFTRRVASVMLLVGLYIFGMNFLGFIIATLLFQWLMLWVIGYRKKLLFFLSPVGVTGVIYVIFVKMMYVPLPRGIGVFRVLSYFFY